VYVGSVFDTAEVFSSTLSFVVGFSVVEDSAIVVGSVFAYLSVVVSFSVVDFVVSASLSDLVVSA
jgi:hypothetical protein